MSATVVLAGPGSVSTREGTNRDEVFLDRLTDRVTAVGAHVVRCEMPAPRAGTSEESDVLARAERLEHLLHARASPTSGPVTLLGFSLGGQAALRLLGDERCRLVERAVLVGTVVERETVVRAPIVSLDLVYGGCDLIGYLAADDPAGALPPVTYGPHTYARWSADRLIHSPGLRVRTHILEGLGHLLQPCVSEPVVEPIPFLADLVDVSGPRRPDPRRSPSRRVRG